MQVPADLPVNAAAPGGRHPARHRAQRGQRGEDEERLFEAVGADALVGVPVGGRRAVVEAAGEAGS